MRIALVSPYDLDVVGGVQAHVLALAAALRATGDEVHVLGPGSPALGRTGLGRSRSIPANGSRAPISLAPRAAFELRRQLRALRPDVVHVHEPLVPLIGLVAASTRVAPVVMTFHASAERGALAPLYRLVRAPARLIVRRAARSIAVSDVAASFHARALGLDPSAFLRVPNGVDVARFAGGAHDDSDANGASSEAAVGERIVVLGRLEHRKGVDVAVRAFLSLAAARPSATLLLLGDGPLRSRITALIDGAPPEVASRVTLQGRVEPEELPALLQRASVLVVPSRGGESFGIVLLEGMAAGVPLVASDIPGYRAVARPEREAVLVPPDDPGALAAGIRRVLEDRDLRASLVLAGRERAAAHDWSRVAATLRVVYAEAVARAGA
jgi:phosphatidyl-myo-inositol alpha-mannosyltransferase